MTKERAAERCLQLAAAIDATLNRTEDATADDWCRWLEATAKGLKNEKGKT